MGSFGSPGSLRVGVNVLRCRVRVAAIVRGCIGVSGSMVGGRSILSAASKVLTDEAHVILWPLTKM